MRKSSNKILAEKDSIRIIDLGRARLMAIAIFIILYRGVSCCGLRPIAKMGGVIHDREVVSYLGKGWSVYEEWVINALNSGYSCNDLMILIDFPQWMDGKTVSEFNVQSFLPILQHKSGLHNNHGTITKMLWLFRQPRTYRFCKIR